MSATHKWQHPEEESKFGHCNCPRQQTIQGQWWMTSKCVWQQTDDSFGYTEDMADQQSAWGSSLNGVFVAVQCMRQYSENSPGCSTAKYTNVGVRRHNTVLEAPSCQMNRNWLYRYRNWPYRYHNWPCQYTDYCTSFAVNRSLSESMQSRTHIECSSFFSFQRNRNRYIFFEPFEVPTGFPFINFSYVGSLFFGQSWKRLSADHLGCLHRRFKHGYFRRTCFVHTCKTSDSVANF